MHIQSGDEMHIQSGDEMHIQSGDEMHTEYMEDLPLTPAAQLAREDRAIGAQPGRQVNNRRSLPRTQQPLFRGDTDGSAI